VREIRTLRVMWRELETESRCFLTGHEGGNPGHCQGVHLRATAPVLDPTAARSGMQTGCCGREASIARTAMPGCKFCSES
jgi:hypothetical protein